MNKLLSAALIGALGAAACGGGDGSTSPRKNIVTCSPTSSGTPVNVGVGGVQVISGPDAVSCVTIPSGGPSEYLAIVASSNPRPDVPINFSITAASGPATSSNVLAAAFDGRVGAAPPVSGRPFGPQERLERHVRAMERTLDRRAASRYWQSASDVPRLGAGARATIVTVPGAVGDTVKYNVPDAATTNLCTNFNPVTAVVKAISTHAIILQDVTSPSNGFTTADFAAIANEFDTELYPSDTLHFGSPSDLDINGRIVILYTPQVNKLTERGENGFVGGFFFGGDLFPTAQCGESNRAELFYLLAPDPTGTFSDKRETDDVRQATRGTIVHEFQHMINAGTRIAQNVDFEVTWLDEGLAHLAEELAGRRERGFDDMRELSINDVADAPDYNDFNAFFYQNLARFKAWLNNPSNLGAISLHADTSLAVRGAAWALLRHTGDQYSNGNFAAYTRALVSSGDTGVTNLTARAGASFDAIVSGWMVAVYADNDGIPGLDPLYTFRSWNLRNVEMAINANHSAYPLQIAPLVSGQALVRKAPPAGGSYFELRNSSSTPVTGIAVVAPDGTKLTDPFVRLYVLRVN